MTQAELIKMAEQHRQWLSGEGGKRAVCRNQDLSGLDFSGLDLSKADFSGSTFAGAKMAGTRWDEASLCGADMSRLASAVDVSFVSTFMHAGNFSGNHFVRCVFKNFFVEQADFSHCDFESGCFADGDAIECNFSHAVFTATCSLETVTFMRSCFNASQFADAIFGIISFEDCTTAGWSLTGVRIHEVAAFYDTETATSGLSVEQLARCVFHGSGQLNERSAA